VDKALGQKSTLTLYHCGKHSIQTMIFWSLCAIIWFKNIEKMLLQMKRVVFCNLSQLYNRECMKQILFRNIFKLNVLLVIYKLFNELGSWVLQDRSLPSLCFKTWTTVRCTLYMPKWMAYNNICGNNSSNEIIVFNDQYRPKQSKSINYT
jgi:hypothetical protein